MINCSTMTSQPYLLQGKLKAKPGHSADLADLLLKASDLVSTAKGCRLYAIGTDPNTPDHVYITEIWDSREDHDNSLKQESVRALIGEAMPLIDGAPEKGQELNLLGGFGI